jgi:chromosome segregation ATPase
MHSASIYAVDPQPTAHYSPIQTSNLTPRPLDQEAEFMDGQDRDAMVDKYISLQEQEEKLDRRINDAEDERSDIAARIVGLQARLEEAEDHKAALMDEKDKTKAEKKSLQSSLNREEQLECGFEAGRRMESKRRKQN